MLETLIEFFVTYGYIAVFGVLLISGFGVPIPEDITLVAGGFISSLSCPVESSFLPALKQCHQVHIMFVVGMAGILIGDSTMFFIGRIFGDRVLKTKIFSKVMPPKRYEWVQEKFEKYGSFLVFIARFMPGLRSPIFVIIGISRKVSYLKFILIDGFAALISVPIWIYLGFWAERQLSSVKSLEEYIKKGQISILIMVALIIISAIFIWYMKKKFKSKLF